MKRLTLFILLICALLLSVAVSIVRAEPIYGQDYLALQHRRFNHENATKYLAEGSASGNLDTTFGESIDSVRYLVGRKNPTYHRTHLINAVCIRNGNCGPYEIGRGHTKASFDKAVRNRNPRILRYVRERSILYRNLAEQYLGTKFLISPALEHDLSKAGWRVLADTVKEVWPEVQLVNSPDGGIQIERYRGAWIERHGSRVQNDADIISSDGAEITDTNIKAFLRQGQPRLILAWSRVYNCRTNSPQFVDPRQRTACPRERDFEQLGHILEPEGIPPAYQGGGCARITNFKAPDIWKPMAEDKNNGDRRANLPVLITKAFGNRAVDVIDKFGHKVGSVGYYGTYLDQGLRYYSGYPGGSNETGYSYQKDAGGHTWLRQGNKCKGPLYMGRRQGVYR